MGVTGLARWINSPTTGLDLVKQNIVRNHSGIDRGRWYLSVRAYRSNFMSVRGLQIPVERSLCTLTYANHVFALLEDPTAPTRSEFLQAQQTMHTGPHDGQGSGNANANSQDIVMGNQNADGTTATPAAGQANSHLHAHPHVMHEPSHYRHTFLTLNPAGALEQLLNQLRARWLSTRQTASTANTAAARAAQNQTSGVHLVIDGNIFTIGTDWIVRVGNVILAGGAVKGMLLEAEYLPLPAAPPLYKEKDVSDLLNNLLASVLPPIPNAKTVAIVVNQTQWDDVLYHRKEPEDPESSEPTIDEDDIFLYEDDKDAFGGSQPAEWAGLERDRRSAFMIMGALKQEGIL